MIRYTFEDINKRAMMGIRPSTEDVIQAAFTLHTRPWGGNKTEVKKCMREYARLLSIADANKTKI